MDGAKGSDGPLHILRAKYHDYCSAQVADLLVYMSPDEIYLLAHRARREEGGGTDVSYAEMVRIATEWLSRRVALPPLRSGSRITARIHSAMRSTSWGCGSRTQKKESRRPDRRSCLERQVVVRLICWSCRRTASGSAAVRSATAV